jgi:uncharacterized membrane protein HdeD (DUF308 family)
MQESFSFAAQTKYLCSLASNWWTFAARGVLALGFGLLAIFLPIATLLAMTLCTGAYLAVDGVFHLVSGLNEARKGHRWGALVTAGALGLGAGLFMLVSPHLGAVGLALLVWTTLSLWGVLTGTTLLSAALRLRREIPGETLLAVNGVLLLLLGLGVYALFLANPAVGVASLANLVGLAALAMGVLDLVLAFRLRRACEAHRTSQPMP